MLDKCFFAIKIGIVVTNQERNMSVKTMIVVSVAFWAYVWLCLQIMGKLAGAI
jgi:hypothetical protein